jgi:carbonic anhydrase
LIKTPNCYGCTTDDYAKLALQKSQKNCLTFPWIKEKVAQEKLQIHLWFFDIKTGEIFTYSKECNQYIPLSVGAI